MQHQVHCRTWGRSCSLRCPEEVIESVLNDFSAAGPVRCWEQVFRLVYPVVEHLWEHLGKEGRIKLNRMNPCIPKRGAYVLRKVPINHTEGSVLPHIRPTKVPGHRRRGQPALRKTWEEMKNGCRGVRMEEEGVR